MADQTPNTPAPRPDAITPMYGAPRPVGSPPTGAVQMPETGGEVRAYDLAPDGRVIAKVLTPPARPVRVDGAQAQTEQDPPADSPPAEAADDTDQAPALSTPVPSRPARASRPRRAASSTPPAPAETAPADPEPEAA
jgi:hypothetical protein